MSDDSFVKGLFAGVVTDGLVFPYPEPPHGPDVHSMLDGVRRFLHKQVDSAEIDATGEIPDAVLDGLKSLGAFGLLIPKVFGGSDLGTAGFCRVISGVSAIDSAVGLTINAHQALGAAAILMFGTSAVKERYLRRLASGESVAAFALTEVGAGSDAASIQMRADADGDDHILSGEKAWVTNGGLADVFVVFARTSAADDSAKPRLTAFVVERGPGVTSGPNEGKLGVRGASTTWLKLDGVRVPSSHVLGEVGRGFKVAMAVLTQARVALAASTIGAAKRLLRLSVERVKERKAFGRFISEFPLMKDKIALMTAQIFAVESMTYLTSGLVDSGHSDYAVESAICKVFGSETLWHVANEALQIAGANGYAAGQPWERLLRDARAPLVLEGTNEILRCFIALSGMQAPSREIEEVTKAMREPIKGFGLLSDFAIRKARSALGRERMSRAHPVLAREAVLFETMTGHLARCVEKALRHHGKNIAEVQFTQKRIADLAIDLYALASVIARTTAAVEKRGEEGARREIDLTSVFVATASLRLHENIRAFDDNDDELRKAIASKTCADGGYPLDIF